MAGLDDSDDSRYMPQRSRSTRRLDADDGFFSTPAPASDPDAQVMVIDDSRSICVMVRYMLQRVGISVVDFQSGVEALQALTARQVAPPRVLLLDIKMPGMNGYDLARELRKNAALTHTQIIMLSGLGGAFNHLKARVVGASGYIDKPFKSDDLVKQVCDALGLLSVTDWQE